MLVCQRNADLQPNIEPNLPVSVTIRFDSYPGPTLPDGTVPIVPIRHTWSGIKFPLFSIATATKASMGCPDVKAYDYCARAKESTTLLPPWYLLH